MNHSHPYADPYADRHERVQTPATPATPSASVLAERNLDNIDFIADGVTGGNRRDKKAFRRASKHSGWVRILRIVFPLIALALIGVIAGAYYWSNAGSPVLALESAELSGSRMVMKNPALKGLDKSNRPYMLTALEAIQDTKNPSQIELVRINANVPMDDGLFAKITAGTGFYDSAAKTLQLGGEVDVATDNGITIQLQDANVDMNAGTLVTNNPVSVNSQQAMINADGLNIEGNGERIVFENNVRMTIYPQTLENSINAAQ